MLGYIAKARKQESFGYDMKIRPTLQEKLACNNKIIQNRKFLLLLFCFVLYGLFSPYVLKNPWYGLKFMFYKHFYESVIILESLLGIKKSYSKLLGEHGVEFYTSLSFRQIIGNTFILTYTFGLVFLIILGVIQMVISHRL